jgi:hypothetical protein
MSSDNLKDDIRDLPKSDHSLSDTELDSVAGGLPPGGGGLGETLPTYKGEEVSDS